MIKKSNDEGLVESGFSLFFFFFSRISNNLRPLPRQYWAASGCTKNGRPIVVTVQSDLLEDGLNFYMQGLVAVN